MGGWTSKHVDEALKPPSPQTPRSSYVLPYDPRSPSDDISRTPISVSTAPSNGQNSTPQDGKAVRVLEVDPRSPTSEVNRTPIVVEAKEASRRRQYIIKPSRLTHVASDTTMETEQKDEIDPRSPTNKVPRTPLEDKAQVFEGEVETENVTEPDETTTVDSSKDESKEDEQEQKNLVKKLFLDDVSADKIRRPLASVQNTASSKTPLGMLQAKQCRSVEEEYNKSHQNIIDQLSGQENDANTIVSSTQFIESI